MFPPVFVLTSYSLIKSFFIFISSFLFWESGIGNRDVRTTLLTHFPLQLPTSHLLPTYVCTVHTPYIDSATTTFLVHTSYPLTAL